MKAILNLTAALAFLAGAVFAQNPAQKVYDAEMAFEKSAREKGLAAATLEVATPDAVCFDPGYPVNCLEFFGKATKDPATMTWKPVVVDVSSNGAMAYTTGSYAYYAKGSGDPAPTFGEFVGIWMRRPDGGYKLSFDIGVGHPGRGPETPWTSPADLGKEPNAARSSAADVANNFFEVAREQGIGEAYKKYLAVESRLIRSRIQPLVGRDAALKAMKKDKSRYVFNTRSVFTQAADLAYVSNKYQVVDADGKASGTGYFVQVWKLRDGRWQIVLDAWTKA